MGLLRAEAARHHIAEQREALRWVGFDSLGGEQQNENDHGRQCGDHGGSADSSYGAIILSTTRTLPPMTPERSRCAPITTTEPGLLGILRGWRARLVGWRAFRGGAIWRIGFGGRGRGVGLGGLALEPGRGRLPCAEVLDDLAIEP